MKLKKKKVIPLKKQIRRLEKKADAALSLYVRAKTIAEYKNCPLCGINPVQASFHFIRRKRKILRWDFRNVVGSCHKCNWIEYRFPDPSRAWFIRRYGVDVYLKLVDESLVTKNQYTLEELEGIIRNFTEELAIFKDEQKKLVDFVPVEGITDSGKI